MYYSTRFTSSLIGTMVLASDGISIIGLWLEDQKYFGGTLDGQMVERNELAVFGKATRWLDRYFAGEKPAITELPLAPIGSGFRQTVWQILFEIPYGEVTTYGQVARTAAKRLGSPAMSAQAIGGAVGHNPISILIPCHRVIGTNGSLTGYAGGIARKVKLLEHEGVNMTHLFLPGKGTAL